MIARSKVQSPWYATPDEIAELTENLRCAHRSLLTVLEAFPAADWDTVGKECGWSASQIVEHTFLTQRILREQIRSHLQDPVRPELPVMMEQQRVRLFRYLPGGGKAQAGKQSTAFQGLLPGDVTGEITAAEKYSSDLLKMAARYPIKAIGWSSLFFGELSALLWLHYPALHTARHIDQLSRLHASFVSL